MPFRRVGRWFAHQPRMVQVSLVVVVLAGLAVGSYYGWRYIKKRNTAGDVAAAWREYNEGLRRVDVEAINAALDHVLAVNPGDPDATRFKAMLDSGEANPETPELSYVLLRYHLRQGHLSEAAREAEKWLAKHPKDWLARCVLADKALVLDKNRKEAEKHLDQLPDPEDPEANLGPDGLHYALKLFEAVGHDRGALRQVIVRRLLPFLRGGQAASASPIGKIVLLECYLDAFGDPNFLNELSGYWVTADKLADDAVSEAATSGDVPALIRLGTMGPRMRVALNLLREHDATKFPDDRVKPLIKAVDDRTRRAWGAVRQKAPDRFESYRGLALLALSENNPAGAIREVIDGLNACGPQAELLGLRANLIANFESTAELQKFGQEQLDAARAAKTDPAKWCFVANITIVLGRNDIALLACQEARKIKSDYLPACHIEAWLRIRNGDYPLAREALLAIDETTRRTTPGLIKLYAQAMTETLPIFIEDEFKAVLEAQAKLKPKTSAPAVGFLLGVLDAAPTREHAEWVASHAARVLADDPNAPLVRQLRALALYRLAELAVTTNPKLGPPVWNETLVAAALRAFNELTPSERDDPEMVANAAALQLKGQGNPATAMRTVGAIRGIEGSLSAWQLEVLGSVLAANDRPAEAVRVLERAARFPRRPAGVWIALAEAYHKNNQPNDARRARDLADNAPNRSAREQAELIYVKQLLLKENP